MRANLFLGLGLVALILGGCGSTGVVEVAPYKPEVIDMEAVLSREYVRAEHDVLVRALGSESAATRERAAYGLGRYHGLNDWTVDALVKATGDEDVQVQTAASFALGILAQEEPRSPIFGARNIPDIVWAHEVDTLGHMDDDLAISGLLRELEHEQQSPMVVRYAAVLATQHRDVSEEHAHAFDEQLLHILKQRGETESTRHETERGGEIDFVWRILFALQRRNAARLRAIDAAGFDETLNGMLETNAWARASFLLWARSTDARARIYAVQGLGTLEYDEAITRELHHALKDNDWRVVCDACVALGREVTEENLQALIATAKHTNPHVRRVAIEALGEYVELREQISRTLDATNADPSSSVQAAAIVTAARLYGEHSAAQLELKRLKQDPVIRAGVAEAARFLPSELGVPLCEILAQDPHLRVAGFALESLGSHKTEESRALLLEYLQHEDNGLRLMAFNAIKETLTPGDLPVLIQSYNSAPDDSIANELRFNLLKAAAAVEENSTWEAINFIREARGSAHDYTARTAETLYSEVRRPGCGLGTARISKRIPTLPDELIALATATENPFVRVETTRGTMVFELFPRETPFHVYNFIELARRGHYDNLDFHRVVPNFVIQGGDTRGDGNGGTTWRGGSLPAEFTPRKYVRGSLGMPRNEDPDSGGSQFFVTHRATPHLDGRYTIFGELREGFDVLDRIEVGDRILSVAVE